MLHFFDCLGRTAQQIKHHFFIELGRRLNENFHTFAGRKSTGINNNFLINIRNLKLFPNFDFAQFLTLQPTTFHPIGGNKNILSIQVIFFHERISQRMGDAHNAVAMLNNIIVIVLRLLIERVRLDEKDYQFLYADDDLLTFMDTETYDQVSMSREAVGDQIAFLQDGMMVTMQSYEGEPISIELPETVVLEVTETEAVVKGQTAASSYKPAILSNGARTMVPPHIETGTRVVVSTADGSYRERARD